MSRVNDVMKEFKSFVLKGNIIDMAVGVIIGGAFSKIVTSLVNDIFMPLLGVITGGVNFNSLKLVLSPAIYNPEGVIMQEEVAVFYGNFLQNIVDFVLIGLCMFFMIKAVAKINAALKEQEEAVNETKPQGPTSEELLTEIRDLLKSNN